jgi:hypothetical protein
VFTAEHDGKFSYLTVPEACNIPEEVTITDWLVEVQAWEMDDNAANLADYSIEKVSEQIGEKGYAVTALH